MRQVAAHHRSPWCGIAGNTIVTHQLDEIGRVRRTPTRPRFARRHPFNPLLLPMHQLGLVERAGRARMFRTEVSGHIAHGTNLRYRSYVPDGTND